MNVSLHLPPQLETIGLGGDGDQVDAFLALERHFGVDIDDTNAAEWRTADDVFGALLDAMPAQQRQRQENWSEFTVILCEETGANCYAGLAPDVVRVRTKKRTTSLR